MAGRYYERHWSGVEHKSRLQQCNLPQCEENVDEVLDLLSTLSEDQSPHLGAIYGNTLGRSVSVVEPILRQPHFNNDTLGEQNCLYSWRKGSSTLTDQGNGIWAKEVADSGSTIPPTPGTSHVCMAKYDGRSHRKRWEKSEGVFARVEPFHSQESQRNTVTDRGFCFHMDQTDGSRTDYENQSYPKQRESLSTFEDLLESSWTSAALHRTTLNLEKNEQENSSLFSRSDSLLQQSLLKDSHHTSKPQLCFQQVDYVSRPNLSLFSVQNAKSLSQSSEVIRSHAQDRGGVVKSAFSPGMSPQEELCLQEALCHQPRLKPSAFMSERDFSYGSTKPTHFASHNKQWCVDCGLSIAEPVATGKASVPNYLSWSGNRRMKENLGQTDLKVKENWKSSLGTLEQNHGDGILHSFNGKLQLNNRGPLQESIPPDGWRLTSKQRHLLGKTHSATGQSSEVSPEHLPRQGLKDVLKAEPLSIHPQSCWLPEGREIYELAQEIGTDERFQALYRFHLLRRCFRHWVHLHRNLAVARQCQRRRVLSSVFSAMHQATEERCAQTRTLQHRHSVQKLAQAFQHWKARVAGRQGRRSCLRRGHDGTVEDLRRRLTQPSNTLLLRKAYCTWRRCSQDQEILRAALIHYHLSLLYKHWLWWRRECARQRQRTEQEKQASQVWLLTLQTHTFTVWRTASVRHRLARQCWERRLQKQAFTDWTSAHQRQQQATGKHRVCVLVRAWHVWIERVELRRCGRLAEAKESAEVYRRSVLHHCLLVWRKRTATQHTSRERSHFIARRVLERWRLLSHQCGLLRLATSLQQLFSRRTLHVAFGRWCEARAEAAALRSQEERVHLLQDRRRLQAALRRWRRALSITRGVTHLQQRSQQTQLAKCLKAWKGMVWQGATLSLLWDLRDLQRVKQSFQLWRNATELCTQHKHLLLHLLFSRQHSFLQANEQALLSTRQHTPEQRHNDEGVIFKSEQLDDQRTLNELCDHLFLQKALHTWKRQALKMHKARVYCVVRRRERAVMVLRRWHQLTQEELSNSVLEFTGRLAHPPQTHTHRPPLDASRYSNTPLSASTLEILAGSKGPASYHLDQSGAELTDCSLSLSHRDTQCPLQASSPHYYSQPADVCVAAETSASRLKEVARGALVRMLCPALSKAFLQWRSLTAASREMQRHSELIRQTHAHTLLRQAFSTWRREMQKSVAAAKHRDRTLLLRSVCVWRECVCQKLRSVALKRRAEEFRHSKLLTRSYSSWRRQCSLRLVPCDPEEEALLMRKGAWLQRSGVKRRLSSSFSLWAARVRQNHAVQAVYTHTLLRRVFVAWEVCVHSRRQRVLLAQVYFERCVSGRSFRWWRTSTAQHQLVSLRTTHTLYTLVSACLLRWNAHTQRMRELRVLQREFERTRMWRIKSAALLMWIEALEKHQRARHTHHLSIMRSSLQRWQQHTQHSVCVRAVCVWLQAMREERSLRWALRVWRGRLRLRLRRRERMWQSVSAVAALWRERALESRARTHRQERITLMAKQCLIAWKDYTQRVCVERVLLCEFEEERKMMMMSRALAVWRQMAEIRWAERHYRSRLQRGAVRHWRSALIGRRRSRERALVAVCVWRQRTFRSRELMERAQGFQWLRRIAVLKHCFLRWNMACTRTRISQDWHRRRVCKRVLLGWQRYTETSQKNHYREAWFQCAREQRLVRDCFAHWQEELRQASLRQAALNQRLGLLSMRRVARTMQYWRAAARGRLAQKRRSRNLLQQCFSVWRESSEELRVEYERRTTREVLISWLLWAKDRRAKRVMVEAMWLWLDSRRVSRSFHQWFRAHQHHQVFSQHYNTLLQRRTFQAWRSVCEDTKQLCEDMQSRVCETLTHQVFHAWRRAALTRRDGRVCLARVCEGRRRGVLRGALRTWKRKFQTRQRRVIVLCEVVFSRWLQLVHKRRTERQYKLMHRYWHVWRQCVRERASQRRLLQLYWACWKNRTATSLIVCTMHNDSMQQRAWLVWRKRRIRSRVAQCFNASLNRALLSKAFAEWRSRTQIG